MVVCADLLLRPIARHCETALQDWLWRFKRFKL
jgi:hypothetical protein